MVSNYFKILNNRKEFEVILTVHRRYYVEIKCQLDATDYIYCRFYCMLNMFRAILCPSSGAREYYTDGRCLWYFVLWFSGCLYGVELKVMCPVCRLLQSANRTHNTITTKHGQNHFKYHKEFGTDDQNIRCQRMLVPTGQS